MEDKICHPQLNYFPCLYQPYPPNLTEVPSTNVGGYYCHYCPNVTIQYYWRTTIIPGLFGQEQVPDPDLCQPSPEFCLLFFPFGRVVLPGRCLIHSCDFLRCGLIAAKTQLKLNSTLTI